MILYHGSNVVVSSPRLIQKNRFLDFVYGPVANDDVYTTFTLYTAGVLTKEQTLETLNLLKNGAVGENTRQPISNLIP